MPSLTKRTLKALKPREWATEDVGQGQPQLRAKGSSSGIPRFYLRHTTSDGRQDDLPIGAFDDLDAARAAARPLIVRYHGGTKDLREALDVEREVAEAAKRAAEVRQSSTTKTVLDAYCDRLERDGKESAAKVRAMIARHVVPTRYWLKPALDFTAEDAVAILAPLVEAGHEREAQKLRAALRAAFKRAAEAATDPKAPATLRDVGLRADPLAALRPIDRAESGARDRAMTAGEWRGVWAALTREPGADGAVMRLHLLLGAPRVEQLARCTLADFDREALTIRMLDSKGRRKTPRQHVVPVIAAALREVEILHAGGSLGPYLFTLDRGGSAAPYNALAHRWRALSRRLVDEGVLSAPVTPGDVRRSVETQLARLGVPGEVRAVLQSHGLGGVVWRHYQRHDFLDEMRKALDQFAAFLASGDSATVVPLRLKRATAPEK
jgi:integrase